MTGGLIQIVAYGSQDLFLTGIPEITFFKYIYKRYTNFAEETIDLKFDGVCNFGEEISCTIPNNGDIIKNIILKIDLPNVSLIRIINNNDIKTKLIEYNTAKINYNNLSNYLTYLYTSIRIIDNLLLQNNSTFSIIKTDVDTYLNGYSLKYLEAKNTIDPDDLLILDITSDLNTIDTLLIDDDGKKEKIKIDIRKYLNESILISKRLQKIIIEKKQIYEDTKNTNNNFSWVENLAYKIIDHISIEIGGNIIDRQYGKWLFIWNQIAENKYQKKILDKLLGKIKNLTDYNKTSKQSTSIYIPLKFWFNKDYGSAIPLISMRYQDVILHLKISKLSECIYTDYDNTINDLIDKVKLLNVTLLTDYIYLDNDERRKFSQATHEYLIEQTKNNFFVVKKSKEIIVNIDFYHPVKYLVWTIQQEKNIKENIHFIFSEITYTKKNNYPTITFAENNPISKCRIELNGVNRIEYMDGEYFNYVQPYECFTNTPNDGINCYSFGLNPLEHQPSGTCNFSKLNKTVINIILSDSYYNSIAADDNLIINVYSVNYNILRFSKGLAGLAFNF
jgi:hypothetical protein